MGPATNVGHMRRYLVIVGSSLLLLAGVAGAAVASPDR